MRPKTKIIATLGDPTPTRESATGTYKSGLFDANREPISTPSLQDVVDILVKAGVDVLRLNVAHVDTEKLREKFLAVKTAIRNAERPTDRRLGVLADLGGPKIRIKNNFVLPSEILEVNLYDGAEDIQLPEGSGAVDRPLQSRVG